MDVAWQRTKNIKIREAGGCPSGMHANVKLTNNEVDKNTQKNNAHRTQEPEGKAPCKVYIFVSRGASVNSENSGVS